jgi:hypothetical protein
MGYYMAGDGYYMAGGFFSFVKKAVSSVGKVWSATKPLVGLAVKAVGTVYPAVGAISAGLAKGEAVARAVTSRGTSRLEALANPAMGAVPSQSDVGRMAQLLSPTAAPAGMPMDGAGRSAHVYTRLSQDERYARLYSRRSSRRRTRRRRRY